MNLTLTIHHREEKDMPVEQRRALETVRSIFAEAICEQSHVDAPHPPCETIEIVNDANDPTYEQG